MADEPLKIAVLISGGGTTLANLLDRIEAGSLRACVVAIVCSNPAAERRVNERLGDRLPVRPQVIHRTTFADTEAFSQAVFHAIRTAGAQLVCLAGFLCLLRLPDDYRDKVLNIHPALLPAFGGQGMFGRHVHEAVLNHGCKISGCTVHFADQTYDTGPILVQKACPVREDDTAETLAARVFDLECQAYPEAIQIIADGRVTLDGRVARIRR